MYSIEVTYNRDRDLFHIVTLYRDGVEVCQFRVWNTTKFVGLGSSKERLKFVATPTKTWSVNNFTGFKLVESEGTALDVKHGARTLWNGFKVVKKGSAYNVLIKNKTALKNVSIDAVLSEKQAFTEAINTLNKTILSLIDVEVEKTGAK